MINSLKINIFYAFKPKSYTTKLFCCQVIKFGQESMVICLPAQTNNGEASSHPLTTKWDNNKGGGGGPKNGFSHMGPSHTCFLLSASHPPRSIPLTATLPLWNPPSHFSRFLIQCQQSLLSHHLPPITPHHIPHSLSPICSRVSIVTINSLPLLTFPLVDALNS